MKLMRYLAVSAIVLLACATAFGQGTVTGQLTGTVSVSGTPVPGVTVTIASPQMQGPRTAVTDSNGDYLFAAIPPGDYKVTFELSGMNTVTRNVRVSLSGVSRADADLKVTAVTEAITVTAAAPAVLETTETQTNMQQKLVNELPTARNVTAVALLAPGTTSNGPRGALQISGATSNDNLIMVDGSNIQENLRGQARPLFIEDAIQETTTMTAGVSAEFGRFTGGVVNAITKSGGNEFSGTFRDSLTNPKWTSISKFGRENPGTETPTNKINSVYEGTIGGRIIRDRLWFFTAGRYAATNDIGGHFSGGGSQFESKTTNRRIEAKLTGQITPKHSLVGTYLKSPLESTNNNQLGVWEQQGLDPSIAQREDFYSLHYSGVLTNNLFLEGNGSKRRFVFVGFGGDNPDPVAGTPLVNWFGGGNINTGVANAPYFCGSCSQEHRDNTYETLKATYFLGTKGFGTHNLVLGGENFDEYRLSNNYQSPTNLTIWLYNVPPQRTANGVLYTVVGPDAAGNPSGDDVEYYPVKFPSLGSHLKTRSLFLNDKWDLSSHLSFNLGARYDDTNAVDQAGNKTSSDKYISPRLGAIYDVAGNGKVRINGTYGEYVGRLAETVQGAGSSAGEPWGYYYYYGGPTFTGTSQQVVQQIMSWFNSVGGVNSATPDRVNIGGATTRILGSLHSPSVREYTLGVGTQLGPRSFVRADYISRKWHNAYVGETNTSTGLARNSAGEVVGDLTLITNTNQIRRNYQGVQLQAGTTVFERFNIGGNYTYSKLRGNQELESTGSGPVSGGGWIFQYPEYQGFVQNSPYGYLAGDQRHKARAWVNTNLALGPVGRLNLSLLERYDSGTPYSAVGSITRALNPAVTTAPGYTQAPSKVTYFFGSRGQYRTDSVARTDFSAEYAFPVSRAELYVKGEVFNLFNAQKVVGPDTLVITSTSSTKACTIGGVASRCQAFNPFTTTPVQGVNYALGSHFGQATGTASYNVPRTYDFSFGARF